MTIYLTIFILFLGFSYLLGSISSAILTCKLMGFPDPRTEGSSNPGATNVLRIGNKTAAIITLLGDFLKGFIPVFLGLLYGLTSSMLGWIALAAFIGHLWPIFFKFQGGKGVATYLGCLLALCWPIGIAALGIWLLLAIIFRYSSLSSLVSAISTILLIIYFYPSVFLSVAIMSILLILRHQHNLRRLFRGEESKIGKKTINS